MTITITITVIVISVLVTVGFDLSKQNNKYQLTKPSSKDNYLLTIQKVTIYRYFEVVL